MAIGDLVREVAPAYDVNLLAFDAKLPDQRIDFANDLLFVRRNAGFVRRHSAKLVRNLLRMSLLELINTYHDTETQGAFGERETIAVPFSHFILRCGPGKHFIGDLKLEIESNVTEQIRKAFGAYVDPLTDIRVRCEEHDELEPDDLVVLFGRGVFLPRPGEQPVGHIRFRARDKLQSVRQLYLADGHTPAGIYRGQKGVSFGDGVRVSGQALVGMPEGASLSIFAGLGRVTREEPNGASTVEGLLRLVPDAMSSGSSPQRRDGALKRLLRRFELLPRRPAQPPKGARMTTRSTTINDADAAWSLSVDKVPHEFEAVIDSRSSRLLTQAPTEGPYFEIVGVAVDPPADDDDSFELRWWIDVDSEGCLTGAAMLPKSYSIVVERGGAFTYDWRRKDWARGSFPRFRLDPDGVLRRVNGPALGYLAAPPRPSKPNFSEDWWMGGADTWPLDWLDFAGAVEREGEQALGLAAWHADLDFAPIPVVVSAAEIRVGPIVLAPRRMNGSA